MQDDDAILQPFRIAVNYFNQLPLADELGFLQKTIPTYSEELHTVDQLVKTCLGQVVSFRTASPGKEREAELESVFEDTQDNIESFLEQADECVDIFKGIKKTTREEPPTDSPTPPPEKRRRATEKRSDIPKPQDKFPDFYNVAKYGMDVVSQELSPSPSTQHQLSNLDNHLGELNQQSLQQEQPFHYSKVLEELKQSADTFQGWFNFSHSSFLCAYHSVMILGSSTVTSFLSFYDSTCTFVDSLPLLQEMITKLEREKEIAVDIENHSYRSFQGFICLLQFSTRQEDFVVDAIELRRYIPLLSKVLENRNILKVLHGANSDVLWLQRDFGLHIVHMFDTGQASRALKFPSFSLAYLLKRYCDIDTFETKKYFQLEDWRIRPLPEAMFSYARQDTHYLLYIYDRLCEELRKQSSLHEHRNLLRDAYRASIEISMLTWKKPEINSLEYQSILSRRKLQFNEKQILVLRALCRWREETARMEDESLAYVLPEFKLIQIARRIPQTLTELYCCCCNNKNNDSSCYNENAIPPLLKKYENEVLRLVAESIAKYNGSLSTATKDESIGNNLDSNPRSTVTLVVSSDSDRVAPVSISSTGSLFSSNVGEQKNESMSTKFDEIRQQVIEQWQSRLYSKPNLKETQKEENEEENKTRQDSMEAENPVENNDEKRKEFKFPQEDIILIADSSSKKKNKKKNRKKKTKKKKKGKSSSTNKLALSGFLDKVKNGSINNNNSNKNKNGNNKGVGEQAAVHKKGIKKNRNPSLSSVRLKQGNRSATF